MYKPEVPSGTVFGRWTVIRREGEKRSKGKVERVYRCACICGVEKLVVAYTLTSGQSKSCGCHKRDVQADRHRTHDLSTAPEYRSWHGMIQRCNNPNNSSYKNYGARGITVAPEWEKFSSFYGDMGNRPEGTTLERKNNDLGYCRENCIWATRKQQQQNRRVCRQVCVGDRVMSISEYAEEIGTTYMTAYHRAYKENLIKGEK